MSICIVAELAKVLGANKKGWACKFASPSHVAEREGFEPTRHLLSFSGFSETKPTVQGRFC